MKTKQAFLYIEGWKDKAKVLLWGLNIAIIGLSLWAYASVVPPISRSSDAGQDLLIIFGFVAILLGGLFGGGEFIDFIVKKIKNENFVREISPSRRIKIYKIDGLYHLYFKRLGIWWKYNQSGQKDANALKESFLSHVKKYEEISIKAQSEVYFNGTLEDI